MCRVKVTGTIYGIRLFLKYRSDELEHTILHRILKGNMGRRSWGREVQLLIKEVGSTEKPAILNHYIEKWRSGMETEELQRRLLASPCIRPTWPASTWHNVLAQVPAPPTVIERSYLRLRLGCYMTAERMSEKGLIKDTGTCPLCDEDEPEDVAHLLRRCPRWAVAREAMLATLPVDFSDVRLTDEEFVGVFWEHYPGQATNAGVEG